MNEPASHPDDREQPPAARPTTHRPSEPEAVESATLIRGMIVKLAIATLVLAAGTAIALASVTWGEDAPPEGARQGDRNQPIGQP